MQKQGNLAIRRHLEMLGPLDEAWPQKKVKDKN